MAKRHEGAVHVFSVGMRDLATTAKFTVAGVKGKQTVEVLDENRALEAQDGVFQDRFEPWDTHLYRIKLAETK
jgi:hypothetical protein